jgi:hypothetical protein
VFGVWQRGRYSEAIFGSHAGKDRMPASPRKQHNIPPFEKGGSGGISIHHYPINLLHHRFRFYHYLPAVKIPPAPFDKGGDVWGLLWPIVKSPRPPLIKGEMFGVSFGLSLNPPQPPFTKGGRCSGFGKGGDIPRLFSDRMPERIACRQVPENSTTFPPFEKGGSGGISIHHYPINLLHHRFRFYHYLPAVKIPPAPFDKGGDVRVFFGLSLNPPGPL